MNLQKRTLKRLKKLLIKERWFNNAEFDSLFVHTYLNTKALVLGHKLSIVILMDKRCDVLRISSNSIKETEEEILKANLILREKLKLDTALFPWKFHSPIPIEEDRAEVPTPDYVVTLPFEGGYVIEEVDYAQVEYRTFTDFLRTPTTNITQGENE